MSGAISRYGFRAAAEKLHINEQGELIAFGRSVIGERVKRAYLYRAWSGSYLVRFEPLRNRAGAPVVRALEAADAAKIFDTLEAQLEPRDLAFPTLEESYAPSIC